jgi:6-phosphofructokinase
VLKGNVIISQSGGPTAVINNSLVGVIQEALRRDKIGELYGALYGIRGVLDEDFIDLRQESAETLELLRTTPGSALGMSRRKLTEDDYSRILDVFEAHNIRHFFYIGGNDSMDTSNKVSKMALDKGYELCVVGVPKTVDNDLVMTDHCPGYGSAARFVANTVRDTGVDTESGYLSTPVKIVEMMGRHAGWVTAASVLGKKEERDPPHLVYIPERPVNLKTILEDILRAHERYNGVTVAISEGVTNPDGEPLMTAVNATDAFGHVQLGGISVWLSQRVKDDLGLKCRFEKPDTMQRSSILMASPVDREEAYRVGQDAVRFAAEGHTDCMVALKRDSGPEYHCSTVPVPLAKVANREKKLPDEMIGADGHSITSAFVEYALPLISGELIPCARLSGRAVPKKL